MRMLLLVMLAISASAALAWGPTGHRVTGEVAQKFLEPEVAIKLQTILGGSTLARISTWPDEIRSEPQTFSFTYPWHYTDWPEADTEHDETKSSGKLVSAIRDQLSVVKDPKSEDEKKVFALKFLVHLVGDVHQPLHVGNGLDAGGNKCKVTFQGKAMNLHQVWDEGMIDFTNLSFTELANFVAQGRGADEIASWKSGDVIDWARESKAIRAVLYPENVAPVPEPMSLKQYCRSDIVVAPEEMPKLGYEYSYKFMPIVEKRLFQGGVRLAMLLNEALR